MSNGTTEACAGKAAAAAEGGKEKGDGASSNKGRGDAGGDRAKEVREGGTGVSGGEQTRAENMLRFAIGAW